MKKHFSRRQFLSLGGLGLAATTLAACAPGISSNLNFATPSSRIPQKTSPSVPKNATPTTPSAPIPADVAIALAAAPASVSLFPGQATKVWQFSGKVLQGASTALQSVPNSYLGPTFRIKKGQRLNVSFSHDLPQESIVHWHGLHIPAEMDGHPQYVINRRETFEYSYKILNRAGTYWYHPHPHGSTGPQVYAGLAGFFLVSDDEEQSLGLPSGEFDIPLVIQDRIFDENNQLVYRANGMMDQMMGFLGNQILVNGQPDFTLPVATQAYRLRLLNGSNSRIYKLGWSDGTAFTVIGTDGGLLEKPVQRPYITLAPAERIELWVDFSHHKIGDRVGLKSLPFASPVGGGMMGGASSLPLGAGFDVLTVSIERNSNNSFTLPTRLSSIDRLSPRDAVATKTVTLAMRPPNGWTLNNRSFQMTDVAPAERVKMNSIEIWEFVNDGGGGGMMGGGMMSLPHPMHMHGEQFQILDRQISRSGRAAWNSLNEGFVDEGWKDTVLVMPGEKVRVIRRFDNFTGLFLYHCHNLEHEDMGMMRNFEVIA